VIWLFLSSLWLVPVCIVLWDTREKETSRTKLKEPLTVFTAILALGTVALAIIAVLQWRTLEKTDQTSRLRDRAFVYFNNPPLTPYPPDKSIVWGVGITVLNAGNMPARSIVIQYDCPDAPRSDQTIDPFPLAKWKRAEIGNVIGPKNQFVLQACNIPIAIVQAAQWSEAGKQPEREIFYVVKVTYLDGFDLDESRFTQMSRKFIFDEQGNHSLGFTGPHNCADDDCPK
jgi:hypothetical protein